MKTTYETWQQEDFLTYLLLYAANSDFVISEEERQFILNRVDEEKYRSIHKLFKMHSDFERSETVRLLGERYCNDEKNKCEIRKDIVKLFFADEDYSLLERNFFIAIKKILKLND